MSFDLTNKNIQDTFQNLLQKTGSEGKLFDLVGNEITDLTIGGTLTAHSYITSESIVNTSSGSTAFGNSSDDTHKFIGNITASGNISGSSTSTLTLGGDITTNNTIVLPGDGGTTHETIINAHNQRGMLKKELNAVYWQVGQGTNQFEITDGANGNSTKGNVLLRTNGADENDNKLFLVPDGAQLNIGGHITAS